MNKSRTGRGVVGWCTMIVLGAATAAYAANWTEGFGDLNNWTVTAGHFSLDSSVSHGSYPPAYSARADGNDGYGHYNTGAMWRSTGSRPYHAGYAAAVHRNPVRWKSDNTCGNRYRTFLSLASADGTTFQWGVGYYSPGVDSPEGRAWWYRDFDGARVAFGQRTSHSCSAGWEFLEVEFRGDGSYWLSADSGGGRISTSGNRTSTVINAGIGRVKVGFEFSTDAQSNWDGVVWTGYAPGTPTDIAATALSTSSIRWTANAASDNNQFGFALMNGGSEAVVSPMNQRQSSASFTQGSLSANTAYTRSIRAWNGDHNSTNSAALTRYTLQVTPTGPTISSVTHDSLTVTTSGPVNLTAGSSGVVFARNDTDLPKIQAMSLNQTGLSPNTSYIFKAKGVNGDGVETTYSGTSGTTTLSAPPGAESVISDQTAVCGGDDVTWTAVGGFGAGTLAYYTYAWDQNAAYTFTGSESQWSGGALILTASSPGDWYLHVQGHNDDGVANGTFSYSVTADDCLPPEVAAAISRKVHGGAGPFAVDVLLSNGVESRSGGPTEVVVTFDTDIEGDGGLDTADVSASSGAVVEVSISGAELAITLSGVDDASKLVLTFPGIVRVGGTTASPSTVCFGVLLGDVNGDGMTNIFDLVAVRNSLNAAVVAGNYRGDVSADGSINIFDLVAVRNNLNQTIVGTCP
ncbi:MAG: hypothetical protein GXY55_02025 [Phycisphaerae bacterium]|nr:hypothetical protein [Phycisphaerae bacterium]